MRTKTNRRAAEAAPSEAKAPSPLRCAGALHKAMADRRPMECGGNDAALAGHALGSVPQDAPSTGRAEEIELPEGWRWAELQEVATTEKEAINPLDHPDELFAYYSIPAYQQGDNPALTLGREILSLKLLVEERSVLFGKLNPRVPKVWLVSHKSERRKIASTEFIPLLPKAAETASDFLYYLCWSGNVMPKAQELVSGSTPSRQRVDASSFLEIRVPVPPLPEQRAIAGVLRTVQGAKEACERVLAAARQLKQSLLHHLFICGTVPLAYAAHVPLKETEIGPMPETWRVARIGELGEVITGTTPSTKRPDFYGGPFMFIAPGDIGSGKYIALAEKHLTATGLAECRSLPRASVVVVCIGATIGKVGLTVENSGATNQQCNSVIPNAGVLAEFLFYAMSLRAQALPLLAGRAAIPIVNKSNFCDFRVPVAPLPEQREIAAQLSAVDAKLAAEESRRAALAALFQSLLHHLMTGQVRLPEFFNAKAPRREAAKETAT